MNFSPDTKIPSGGKLRIGIPKVYSEAGLSEVGFFITVPGFTEAQYTPTFAEDSLFYNLMFDGVFGAEYSTSGTDVISLRISKLQNPYTSIDQSFGISTLTSLNQKIDEVLEGILPQITPNLIANVVLSQEDGASRVVNKETELVFELMPKFFPAQGSLEIKFPEQFALIVDQITCSYMDGFKLDLIDALGCTVNGNTVKTVGIYYVYDDGLLLKLKILGVDNPRSTAETNSFVFTTYDQAGVLLC